MNILVITIQPDADHGGRGRVLKIINENSVESEYSIVGKNHGTTTIVYPNSCISTNYEIQFTRWLGRGASDDKNILLHPLQAHSLLDIQGYIWKDMDVPALESFPVYIQHPHSGKERTCISSGMEESLEGME